MKNLSPFRVHHSVQQFYAGYAWLINYASYAFPVGSSLFSLHTTVSSSLRKALCISMMFFSRSFTSSLLIYQLWVFLCVFFFLELSSLFLPLCHATFQQKNQHTVYRVPDINLFPPDCPGRSDTFPLLTTAFVPGYSFLSSSPPWLDLLRCTALIASSLNVLLFVDMCPPSCFLSPNPYHYSPSIPLCLSYLTRYYPTPLVSAGSVILISFDVWAVATYTLALMTAHFPSLAVSHVLPRMPLE